jgi:hypothetical protein
LRCGNADLRPQAKGYGRGGVRPEYCGSSVIGFTGFEFLSDMKLSLPPLLRQALTKLQTTPIVGNFVHEAACIITPAILFLCFFNVHVLDPTRISWVLQNDWGQHSLGWNAFRHEPWSSFNHESFLGAPTGLSIIYTDSNPLFAFIFKALNGILPANFQYIGLWFFFCTSLHFIFAYKLVKPHAPNRWAAYGGALCLSVLPALYYRMRHDTLMAHWLILWGLHLFINVRDDNKKTLGWACLLGLTGLIHPYLLFMVAAIWSGDVLRAFWPAARAMDRRALLDTVWRAVVVFICPLITLGLSGAYAQGQAAGAGGWGYYSMDLLAIFNPVKPEFSNIIKNWPLNGGQAFEGYQYLGAGLIGLMALAVALYFVTPEAKAARPVLGRLKPLILPFLCLFAIALSSRVMVYNTELFHFDLPPALRSLAAVLRASGRFFWPISYTFVFMALVVLYNSRPKIIAAALPIVLAVQAYDLAGFAATMRDATLLAQEEQIYNRTPSPTWDKLIARSSGIDFYPPNVHFDDRLFYELTWRATSAAKPVNTMYAARENLVQLAYETAGQDAFKHGVIRNDHLLVFLKQCDAPPQLQSRLRMLDNVWVIPPDNARDIALDKPVWDPIKTQVRFGWLDQGTCMLDENWSRPDTEGVWTEAPVAEVQIPIKHVKFETPTPPKALDLDLNVGSHKPLLVSVLINGKKVSELELDKGRSKHIVPLPNGVLRDDNLNVGFVVEKPLTPDVIPASPPAATGRGAVKLGAKTKDAGLTIKLMKMDLVERGHETDGGGGSTGGATPRPVKASVSG